MPDPHAHCGFCGAAFADGQPWPRTCAACQQISYRNPLPVAVALLPVTSGLLMVRRELEPKGLALPGGYINSGEDWRVAAAREAREEIAVDVNPYTIKPFAVHSAPDGTLLVFGLAPPLRPGQMLPFEDNEEASGREIIYKPHDSRQLPVIVFDLHSQVVEDYFRHHVL